MLPFTTEKLDVLLDIAVRECQGEIIGSLCAAKPSDGKPYFSKEKIEAVMSIADNRGCRATMALVFPSCCKSLIASACSGARKGRITRCPCRACVGFATDVAVASNDFELAEKTRATGAVMREVLDPKGYRYTKKLVAAKLYEKALELVEHDLHSVFAPLVLDLIPDSEAWKSRLHPRQRESMHDNIVKKTAVYGEWDVLLESLNGCKALSTVECALSTACKKSRWDVAERIVRECRLVSRSRMMTMMKSIGSALGRTAEARAVASNLRKRKSGAESRGKRKRASSR
jgi:hypothetical protein